MRQDIDGDGGAGEEVYARCEGDWLQYQDAHVGARAVWGGGARPSSMEASYKNHRPTSK